MKRWLLFSIFFIIWLTACQNKPVIISPTVNSSIHIAAATITPTYTPTITLPTAFPTATLGPTPIPTRPPLNPTRAPTPINTPRPRPLVTPRPAAPSTTPLLVNTSFACPPLPVEIPNSLPTPVPDQAVTLWPASDIVAPVYPTTPLIIAFAQDVVSATVQLETNPGLGGAWSWPDARTLVITPGNGCFPGGLDYDVIVKGGVLNPAGETVLAEDAYFRFATADYQDLVHFGWGADVDTVQASGDRHLPFALYRAASMPLQASIYQLTQEQFFDLTETIRYTSYPSQRVRTGYLTKLQSWELTVNPPTTPYFELRDLVLPAELPPGFYLVELTAAAITRQLPIVLTDNRLVVKESPTQIMAWVTDFESRPQIGATVSVYSAEGQLLHEGLTANDGVYQWNSDGVLPDPLFVTARIGDDTTITVLNDLWRTHYTGEPWNDMTCWEPRADWVDLTGHVFTDNPVYHGGDTVHFRAYLFATHDGDLAPLPPDTPVTVRLDNILPQTLIPDAYSSIQGEYELLPNVRGLKTLSFTVGEQVYAHTFMVVPRSNPDHHLSIVTEPAQYVPGQPLTITVSITDEANQPAPDIPVALSFMEQGPEGWYGDDFILPSDEREKTTDESGRAIFVLTRELWGNYGGQWLIQASALDSYATYIVTPAPPPPSSMPAPPTLSIAITPTLRYPDEDFVVTGWLNSGLGQPLSGRVLTLELSRNNRGHYEVTYTTTLTTDHNGSINHTLAIGTPGTYQVRLRTEEAGQEIISLHPTVHVLGTHNSDPHLLRIIPESTVYTTEDTARLYIESHFSGLAWLTVERGQVRRQELVTLTAPVTVLDLPLENTDVPSVDVSLSTWTGGGLTTATQRLWIWTPAWNLTITPDVGSYTPGQTVNFAIRVTDNDGNPVPGAQLTLALAPEQAFFLATFPLPSLGQLRPRPDNLVYTYDTLWPYRNFFLYYPTGGCYGLDEHRELGWPYLEYAQADWFPELITDANGLATLTVTMPETPGSWRLVARMMTTDFQFTEAALSLEVAP